MPQVKKFLRFSRDAYNLKGFTITEMVIVTSVILILCAVTMPLIRQSMKAGHQTVALQRMKQLGTLCVIYQGDYDIVPSLKVLSAVAPKNVTCDPEDAWRHDCKGDLGAPLIGSFAYVRGLVDLSSDATWRQWSAEKDAYPLFLSVFYASVTPRLPKEDKDGFLVPPRDLGRCMADKSCFIPDKLLFLKDDTSGKTISTRAWTQTNKELGGQLFTWGGAFNQIK